MNKHSPTGKRGRYQAKKIVAPNARYHSAAEFARRLGVGRTTLWRLMRAGRIKYTRISPTLTLIPVSEYARLERQPLQRVTAERSVALRSDSETAA